ncbi:hypothetical protein ERO13_A04G075150v2 [Gossypium hirsutum]|nr:hypothetical protein ERO13_A04G075150v2 [Gossypium hirsutum]
MSESVDLSSYANNLPGVKLPITILGVELDHLASPTVLK